MLKNNVSRSENSVESDSFGVMPEQTGKQIDRDLQKLVEECAQMSHNVFVYGTLKRNEPNHYWLTRPENGKGIFIAEGTTKDKYPLIIATKYNIPFLLYSRGEGNYVKGEVYEVDDVMLSKLDILEDHPNYYVREIDDIVVKRGSNSETIKCWVYFLKKFRQQLLNFPIMADYSSKGSHGLPYMERSKRDPNYDHRQEL